MIQVDKVVSRGRSKRKADRHCPTAQVIVNNRTVHLKFLHGKWIDWMEREHKL